MQHLYLLQFTYSVVAYSVPYVVLLIAIYIFKYAPAKTVNPENENINTYIHPAYSILKQVSTASHHSTPSVYRWLHILYISALSALALFALAGPYYNGKTLPPPPEYRDIVFIVDNEISMVLKDYLVDGKRVDRLTMVKSTLTHLTDQLRGNRMSIIAFSEQAYTLVPLTLDTQLLKAMIDRMSLTMTGRTSDPANALAYAASKFAVPSETDKKPPAMVLITGVNRAPRDINPVSVAAQISAKGYTLHVVAIGANSYTAKQENVSTLIYEPANYQLLSDVAEAGQGRFYKVENTNSLQQAIDEIQKADKQVVNVEPVYEKIPLYHWPLAAITLLIIFTNLFMMLRVRLR